MAPGQPPPRGWEACERIVVDGAALERPAPTVAALHERWAARVPVLVELHVDLEAPPAERHDGPVWGLRPDFEFPLERLHHLVWANAVDARGGGAVPSPVVAALEPPADLVVDGGPIQPLGAGDANAVPLVNVEHGRPNPLRAARSGAELAPDQLEAVHHAGGPARIIAPAGSGKTRVLTERARLLLRGWGVAPEGLTLVAFNVRAADEMRQRTTDLPDLRIRTLNSLGLAIVNATGEHRRPGGGANRRVVDEREVRRLLDELVELPRQRNTDPAAPWLEALAQVRLGLRDPAEVEAEYGGDIDGFAEVFDRYRDTLAARALLDFDEQIYGAIELLCRDPTARRLAQRSCRMMLVDEFQDLSPAHLVLIRLLAAPGYDVFGVGDDDQTIYGYAGARPDWLIDYRRWFPAATEHALEVNYRCPPAIVTAAGTLLGHNARRVVKTIRPAPGRIGRPDDLHIDLVDDPTASTVGHVRRLLDQGVAPPAIAVLTRVNITLAPVQVALHRAGIPTSAPVDESFLGRTGVRAALAWLRLAVDPDRCRGADVREAARRPGRGLSPRVIEWMAEQRDRTALRRLAGRLRERDAPRLEAWLAVLDEVAARAGRDTTDRLLARIRDDVGLGRVTDSLDAARRAVDRSSHADDLDALAQLGRLHADPRTFSTWLADALAGVVADPAGVHLSTVHRVKGQEWPYVIVHGVSAGQFPHRLADDVEEERRVFHVAFTRAAERCVVVAEPDRPSPFLHQMYHERPPGAPPEPTPERTRMAVPATAVPGRATRPGDDALREALRDWRRKRSAELSVPAYVVFNDRTLDAIVGVRPGTEAELLACPGIGPRKLEDHGADILAIVADH